MTYNIHSEICLVINVGEIRDIVGQVIVDALDGKDVEASAKKAAELMKKKMEK